MRDPYGPIYDNHGTHIANRVGNEVVSLDGKKSYLLDPTGNLLDKATGVIRGHLIPAGQYLPDGRPSPSQDLF
jgi:hypothetical protein